MADNSQDNSDPAQEVVGVSLNHSRVMRPDDPWPIDPYVESGIFLARHLNELVDSLDSTNFVGAGTRPAYLTAGGMWTQQLASGKVSLWLYTGSVDILIGDSDGIGTDQIDMTELTEFFQANLDFGVVTFNDRDGAVVPAEGDYDLVMLGDVNISSLTKDDMLQFNGTSWENNPPKLIDTELNFAGPINPLVAPPASAKHADIYIADRNGAAHPSFTGIAGQNVRTGNALGYSTNHNANGDKVPDGTGGAWFLLGDVFSAGVTSIGSGAGISVDSRTPATPVVSVDRTTTDSWYQAKGNYEPAFSKNSAFNKNFGTSAGTVAEGNHGHSNYALSGHNHTGVYSPVGHTHTEYEPKFNKNTAFNKNFGSGYNDVPRGDHTHPDAGVGAHTQSAATITAGTFATNAVYYFQSGIDTGDRIYCKKYIDADMVIRSKQDVIAYYTSDERLKDNVTQIDNALDKVLSLRGCEFDWNDKQDIYEGHDYSVIAQDVEATFPELVREQNNGYKGVKIEKLIAPMIEAMRELSEEVRVLKAEVAALKGDD